MLAALTVCLGWLIFHQLHRSKTEIANNWPVALGTITVSQVRTRESGGANSEIYYYPEVQYRYSVEGQSYQGFRVSFSSVHTRSPKLALELIARLSPGASVAVRYNPHFPADSVLEGVTLE